MPSVSETTENGARLPGPSSSRPEKDLEAHLASLNNVPLFMKDLPSDETEDTTVIDALQSLTFDGTPDEVATNFKNQGNEYFVAKRYKEARNFYTQGIDAFPTDTKLQETLLTNRAACNLEMQNYGMTLKDCSQALSLNPKLTKAFYRSAKALLALDRFIEAVDCCDHALLIDEGNTAAKQLKSKIMDKKATVERKEAETKEIQRRQQESKVAMGKALLARGVWVEISQKPPDNPNPAHFDLEAIPAQCKPSIPLLGDEKWIAPDSIRTPVIFPVLFLYPIHFQSDLISHFHEDTTIASHLDMMFPEESRGSLSWDTKGEYVSSNLNVYATTKRKRLLKLGKKITLREVLDKGAVDADKAKGIERDGIVMLDGFISLVILPKGEGEQKWINQFKAKRDAA